MFQSINLSCEKPLKKLLFQDLQARVPRETCISIGTDERNTWTFGYLSVDSLLRVYSWSSRTLKILAVRVQNIKQEILEIQCTVGDISSRIIL